MPPRVALRRTSLLGAHRFTGPVCEQRDGGRRDVDWRRLAEYTCDELSLRTGVRNEEFLEQVDSSCAAVAAALATGPVNRCDPDEARVRRYVHLTVPAYIGIVFIPHPRPAAATRVPGPRTRPKRAPPSRCGTSPCGST
ncbi:putative Rhizobactin siderophore biosynthesis protein RhbC [Streptomyces afghaniensis 772] [Streptomyces afghaniensis]